MIIVVILAALLAVVLTADRVAVIRTQGWMARRIEAWGFSAKPEVTIAGFPFLTQMAARRLNRVVIRAAGKKLGPVEVKHFTSPCMAYMDAATAGLPPGFPAPLWSASRGSPG